MSELINRIRKHNSWRRGEHSEVHNVTQIGLDLDRIADEHDKLTEQNKLLREALMLVRNWGSDFDDKDKFEASNARMIRHYQGIADATINKVDDMVSFNDLEI